MNYEAWRISFQDSEQAARAAFAAWQAAEAQLATQAELLDKARRSIVTAGVQGSPDTYEAGFQDADEQWDQKLAKMASQMRSGSEGV